MRADKQRCLLRSRAAGDQKNSVALLKIQASRVIRAR
jgi:hypothetical protein